MNPADKKPNFFIVGFMKSGTTSLAKYLKEHPNVFITKVKEPHYFSQDLNYGYTHHYQQYLALFEGVRSDCLAIGEASTGYVFSKEAVPNILKFNPEAKFIVMVRNPVEMAPSLHGEWLSSSWENIESFREAWNKQDERKQGLHISSLCLEPKMFQYGEVCKVGKQVKRLLDTVDRRQVHIIFFDDFIKNTEACYLNTLQFLGVPDFTPNEFTVQNARKEIKNKFFHDLVARAALIKGRLIGNRLQLGIGHWLMRFNMKKAEKQMLDIETLEALVSYFKQDIQMLEGLLEVDLSHWYDLDKLKIK